MLGFIVERHSAYLRKAAGKPKPWSTHPVYGDALRRWRFTNVYRELDTVTRWIADQWRTPHRADPDLWFAMAVARFVNWPDSLAEVGYPVPWDPDRFVRAMDGRQRRGEKLYSAAYTIHAPPRCDGSKAAYLAGDVLTPLWDDRASLRGIVHGTLAEAHRALTDYHGVGSFMAGQVVCDLKYVGPLRGAPDWWTWAASGPGSQRGLNRVLGRPVKAPWAEPEWLRELQELHRWIAPRIAAARMPPLHAQDLQSCLCEVDKMLRLRFGEGTPKCKYPGLPGDR